MLAKSYLSVLAVVGEKVVQYENLGLQSALDFFKIEFCSVEVCLCGFSGRGSGGGGLYSGGTFQLFRFVVFIRTALMVPCNLFCEFRM